MIDNKTLRQYPNAQQQYAAGTAQGYAPLGNNPGIAASGAEPQGPDIHARLEGLCREIENLAEDVCSLEGRLSDVLVINRTVPTMATESDKEEPYSELNGKLHSLTRRIGSVRAHLLNIINRVDIIPF